MPHSLATPLLLFSYTFLLVFLFYWACRAFECVYLACSKDHRGRVCGISFSDGTLHLDPSVLASTPGPFPFFFFFLLYFSNLKIIMKVTGMCERRCLSLKEFSVISRIFSCDCGTFESHCVLGKAELCTSLFIIC